MPKRDSSHLVSRCQGDLQRRSGDDHWLPRPEIHVDVWSGNHPFFTGTQKILDTEGRVDRFMKKYGMGKFSLLRRNLIRPASC